MTEPVICLGFKDWHLTHLVRCLDALRRQTAWPIVLTDLGSAERLMPRLRALCWDRGVRLVSVVEAVWSRSRALNVAAAVYPEASYYVFTDADMLFPPSWFDAARGAVGTADTLWLTRARDLDEVTTDNLPPVIDEAWLLAHTTAHPEVGQGAGMVVPGAWFRRVGGFDEAYAVWGAEDNDLVQRALWDGQAVEWLPEAWVAHQWHRRDWPTPEQFEQVRRNRAYLAARVLERGPIVRNTLILTRGGRP